MAKKANHLHKYKRIKFGINKRIVFKCIFPSCTRYLVPELTEGELVICNKCEKPFIMDKYATTLSKPHCSSCTNRKGVSVDSIEEFIKMTGV